MKLSAALSTVLLVAACATIAVPQTPEQAVYQVKADYNAALTVAIAYKHLPPCEVPPAPVICSKASVVAQLQRADNVAFPALQAAENTVRTPGAGANVQTAIVAAQQAVAAFASITATVKTK